MKIRTAVMFDFRYVLAVNITHFAEPTWLCCSEFRYLLCLFPYSFLLLARTNSSLLGSRNKFLHFMHLSYYCQVSDTAKQAIFQCLEMLLCTACLEGQRMGFAAFTFPISHLAGNLGPRNAAGSSVQEVFAHRSCSFFWVLLGG